MSEAAASSRFSFSEYLSISESQQLGGLVIAPSRVAAVAGAEGEQSWGRAREQ